MGKAEHKQQLFAHAYVANGGNGAQAAIEAGYAKKSARITASKLLTLPNVMSFIEAARKKALDDAEVSVAELIKTLTGMVRADITDAFTENHGLKPLSEWPKGLRMSLAKFEVHETHEFDYDAKKMIPTGELKKVGLIIRTDPIDKLLKVLGGYAPEKKEVTVVDLDDDLRESRRRALEG